MVNDGNSWQEVEQKRERARTRLQQLKPILTTKKLHVCSRLKIYKVTVSTILVDASEGWWLTGKARRMLRVFNARACAQITQRTVREELTEPSYNLLNRVVARRLRYLQKIMTRPGFSLQRLAVRAQMHDNIPGALAADAPPHNNSFAELQKICRHKKKWNDYVDRVVGKGDWRYHKGADKARKARRRHSKRIMRAQAAHLLKPIPPGTQVVYTDGSTLNNGCVNARAGSGAHFPGLNPAQHDISTRLPGHAQTNNRAELYAVILALKHAKNQLPVGRLLVRTDSGLCVKGVNEYMMDWELLGWTNMQGGALANARLWITLSCHLAQMRAMGWEVAMEWVPDHVNIPGNERADALAKAGASLPMANMSVQL